MSRMKPAEFFRRLREAFAAGRNRRTVLIIRLSLVCAAFVGAVGRGAVPEKFNSAGGVDLAMEDFSGWRELLFTLFAIKAE